VEALAVHTEAAARAAAARLELGRCEMALSLARALVDTPTPPVEGMTPAEFEEAAIAARRATLDRRQLLQAEANHAGQLLTECGKRTVVAMRALESCFERTLVDGVAPRRAPTDVMNTHKDSVTAPLHAKELERLHQALAIGGDLVLLEVERIEEDLDGWLEVHSKTAGLTAEALHPLVTKVRARAREAGEAVRAAAARVQRAAQRKLRLGVALRLQGAPVVPDPLPPLPRPPTPPSPTAADAVAAGEPDVDALTVAESARSSAPAPEANSSNRLAAADVPGLIEGGERCEVADQGVERAQQRDSEGEGQGVEQTAGAEQADMGRQAAAEDKGGAVGGLDTLAAPPPSPSLEKLLAAVEAEHAEEEEEEDPAASIWREVREARLSAKENARRSSRGRVSGHAESSAREGQGPEVPVDTFAALRRHLKVCRTQLEDLFRECDRDLDGRLSPKEAFQMLRRCAAGVSKRELRHFMLMCKVDSEPHLSFKELVGALKESERAHMGVRAGSHDETLKGFDTIGVYEVLLRLDRFLCKERFTVEKFFTPLVEGSGLDTRDLALLAQSMFPGLHPQEIDYAVLEMQRALADEHEEGAAVVTLRQLCSALRLARSAASPSLPFES